MRLHRIYSYDAKPLDEIARIPLSGEIIDFGASAAASHNKQIQSALAQRPFYALRSLQGERERSSFWSHSGTGYGWVCASMPIS
jgi:hypothetical protein